MTKEDAALWQEALVPLMRRTIKRDPPQYKFYRCLYYGVQSIVNPMGFLRSEGA
jgi:hypothetical protein